MVLSKKFAFFIVFLIVGIEGIDFARPNDTKLLSTQKGLVNIDRLTNWFGTLLLGTESTPIPSENVNLTAWPGSECQRYCALDGQPRICYFQWTLEHYHAMGP